MHWCCKTEHHLLQNVCLDKNVHNKCLIHTSELKIIVLWDVTPLHGTFHMTSFIVSTMRISNVKCAEKDRNWHHKLKMCYFIFKFTGPLRLRMAALIHSSLLDTVTLHIKCTHSCVCPEYLYSCSCSSLWSDWRQASVSWSLSGYL